MRQLVQRGQTTGTVTLDPSVSTTEPYFSIWSGADEIYQEAKFNVPRGRTASKFDAAYQYAGQSSLLHVALFEPNGTYAGYSLPQGLGDYADVEVANPPRGQVDRGLLHRVGRLATLPGPGTSGPVPWNASFWQYQSRRERQPGALVIPAGSTRDVTLTLHDRSNPATRATRSCSAAG